MIEISKKIRKRSQMNVFKLNKIFCIHYKYEENRDYSYSVEMSRGGGYKLVVTDWSTDYRQDTVIKIPSFILEENWYNDVESQRINRRINEINKEINKIEVIMASGTGQIMELNKEKEKLEIKLRELK